MIMTIIVLIILVQGIQVSGNLIAQNILKHRRK